MRDEGEAIALDIAKKLKEEDYDFTVNVNGVRYDVYHFTRNGKTGQMAFAIIDGMAVIGALRVGIHSEEEMEAAIAEGVLKQ